MPDQPSAGTRPTTMIRGATATSATAAASRMSGSGARVVGAARVGRWRRGRIDNQSHKMPALVIIWMTFSELSVNGSTGGASKDCSGGRAGSEATPLPTAYSIDRDSTSTR